MDDKAISLPAPLLDWTHARVAEGAYSSASEYVGDLIRQDWEAQRKLRILQAAIDEGRASGISDVDPFAYLLGLRTELRASVGSTDAA